MLPIVISDNRCPPDFLARIGNMVVYDREDITLHGSRQNAVMLIGLEEI